jgi:hypothetical protein
LPDGTAYRWVVDTATLFPVKLTIVSKDSESVTDYSRFTLLAKPEADAIIRTSLTPLPEKR